MLEWCVIRLIARPAMASRKPVSVLCRMEISIITCGDIQECLQSGCCYSLVFFIHSMVRVRWGKHDILKTFFIFVDFIVLFEEQLQC